MADGKAQITDLNLTQIDANLSDYLSDIRPYEGFVQCNSPWIGGLLNNVYKKKVTGLPEGHKLVKVHKGDIYSISGEEKNIRGVYVNSVYKNGEKIGEVETTQPKVRDYIDPFCKVTANNELIINYYNVHNYVISYDVSFTYDYAEYDNKLWVTIYPVGNIEYSDFNNSFSGIRTFVFSHDSYDNSSDNYRGLNAIYITNGSVLNKNNELSVLGDYIVVDFFTSLESIEENLYSFFISPVGFVMTFNWAEVNSDGKTTYSKSLLQNYVYYLGKPNRKENTLTKNVSFSDNSYKWTRGLLLPSSSEFNTLIYNNEISGISINNSVLTYNVDKIIKVKPCNFDKRLNIPIKYTGAIIYEYEGKQKEIYCEKNITGFVDFYLVDKFICFSTVGYYNTLNLDTGELFCRADDYNDRIIPKNAPEDSGTVMFVSGWNVNVLSSNKNAFSPQYAQQPCKINKNINFANYYVFGMGNHPDRRDLESKHNIELYYSDSVGENAKYKISFGLGTNNQMVTHKNYALEDFLYPLNSANNMLYNVPMLMDIKQSYINENFASDEVSSYLLIKNNINNPVLGYYLLSFTDVQDIFITQGQFYGINDKYIFSIALENSVASINNVVANKQDLMFLGAFPTMALFWSKLDKSLYSFTGDAILRKVKEAYRINNIYNVYCDPSRLTMIISTDIGVIIIYQNQTMLLEEMKEPIEHIYYDSNIYVLDDTLLSLSEKEDYEPQNIKLHTEYYGVGSGVKSVNDCVYIRIAKGKKNGFIKFQSFVLNDRSTASEEKTVDLPDSVFDPITNSAYIKYQPKNQAGLGFSVKIETTNPVVSMAIGHKPESIANTSLKL